MMEPTLRVELGGYAVYVEARGGTWRYLGHVLPGLANHPTSAVRQVAGAPKAGQRFMAVDPSQAVIVEVRGEPQYHVEGRD